GDHAGHHRGQPRLREDRVPQAGLPRRHDLRGDRGGGHARVEVAAAVGHRDLRAPREKPARGPRHARAPQRDDAQARVIAARVMALARRRRSLHFVPGGNERMMAKALTLPADGLILDLEDAVAPDLKEATRPVVLRWLTDLDFGGRERWVRMNPIATGLGVADLEATIAGRPEGYVVPKPRHAGDVREISQHLDRLEHRHGLEH